jgi:hypothetical protein
MCRTTGESPEHGFDGFDGNVGAGNAPGRHEIAPAFGLRSRAVLTDDQVRIPHREFDFTEPWNIPEGCPPLVLTRSHDGTPPRLATLVHVFRDDQALYVLYSGVDSAIRATRFGRDEALWEEDVLEIFVATGRITRYVEIEVSPLGTLCDATIESPDGNRSTMKADFSWNAKGAWSAIRRVRRGSIALWRFETLLAIPFEDLGGAPAAGDLWRANFFRIDRDPSLGDEYSAWRPTGKIPPDFHVPACFGTLAF